MYCLISLSVASLFVFTLFVNCGGQLFLPTTIPIGLLCFIGPDHDSEITFQTPLLPKRCPITENNCLRLEATLLPINQENTIGQRVAVGLCANTTDCRKLSCNLILQRYWSVNVSRTADDNFYLSGTDYSGSISGNWGTSYNVESCSFQCCTEDRCNLNTITEIQNETTGYEDVTIAEIRNETVEPDDVLIAESQFEILGHEDVLIAEIQNKKKGPEDGGNGLASSATPFALTVFTLVLSTFAIIRI